MNLFSCFRVRLPNVLEVIAPVQPLVEEFKLDESGLFYRRVVKPTICRLDPSFVGLLIEKFIAGEIHNSFTRSKTENYLHTINPNLIKIYAIARLEGRISVIRYDLFEKTMDSMISHIQDRG